VTAAPKASVSIPPIRSNDVRSDLTIQGEKEMEAKLKQFLRSLRGFIPALADSLGPKLDERRHKAEFHVWQPVRIKT
jgi:hypothetical protein